MPTRHQVAAGLLNEFPHLRIESGAFRIRFVIRAIYHVGVDVSALANFTGYNTRYVRLVLQRDGNAAMKAYRSFLRGEEYTQPLSARVKTMARKVTEVFKQFRRERRQVPAK